VIQANPFPKCCIHTFQIIGGPNWMTTDRWDIEARAEEGTVAPLTGPPDPNRPSPVGIRLQSLLEDKVGQTIIGPAGPPPPGVLLPPVDPSGPSLVTALQDQLGLKLDSTKGPVQVLLIDGAQKPTEN
jgi:hypothetical protein